MRHTELFALPNWWRVAAEGFRYLQTAISRPAIENWEDEEGLIPQHITGAPVESRRGYAPGVAGA
jgi:hypothetical protein